MQTVHARHCIHSVILHRPLFRGGRINFSIVRGYTFVQLGTFLDSVVIKCETLDQEPVFLTPDKYFRFKIIHPLDPPLIN